MNSIHTPTQNQHGATVMPAMTYIDEANLCINVNLFSSFASGKSAGRIYTGVSLLAKVV